MSWLGIALMAAFAISGLFATREFLRARRRTAIASGKVAALEGFPLLPKLVIQFEDGEGNIKTFASDRLRFERMQIGARVAIAFDPLHPDNAEISFSERAKAVCQRLLQLAMLVGLSAAIIASAYAMLLFSLWLLRAI